MRPPPDDTDCTCDLSLWQHCSDKKNIEDPILKSVWSGKDSPISFVFHQKSHGKQITTV